MNQLKNQTLQKVNTLHVQEKRKLDQIILDNENLKRNIELSYNKFSDIIKEVSPKDIDQYRNEHFRFLIKHQDNLAYIHDLSKNHFKSSEDTHSGINEKFSTKIQTVESSELKMSNFSIDTKHHQELEENMQQRDKIEWNKK